MYPVVEIINMFDQGIIKGPVLVSKLLAGGTPSRQERTFLVNTLVDYLMENAVV